VRARHPGRGARCHLDELILGAAVPEEGVPQPQALAFAFGIDVAVTDGFPSAVFPSAVFTAAVITAAFTTR
jgi:hypothetical protein